MIEPPRSEQVIARLVQEEDVWDALRPEWEALYAASPHASTPLDFAWLRGWWRVYGPTYGPSGLRIVTVWRGSHLIGAIPLYAARGGGGPLGVRTLRFLSTGEAEFEETCPDYLNLLSLPGEEAACLDAVSATLGQLSWDRIELPDIPEDSPLLRLRETLPVGVRSEIVPRGACPVADLGQGFEAYLKQLSAKPRQHARQYLRAAERFGGRLELATGPDTDKFFDDLVRLHQERWAADGKPGCFAAPRFTEFHRALARVWVPGSRAVLARLVCGDQVYAVIYGFLTRSKFDFYQSGVRRSDTGPFESPGTTANLLLMRWLAGQGATHYDFLRGSSSYKERLSTEQRPLISLNCHRPTVRVAIQRTLQYLRRGATRAARLLGRG